MGMEVTSLAGLECAERLARTSLDDTSFPVRVAEDRGLDDEAADRLALDAPAALTSRAEASGSRR